MVLFPVCVIIIAMRIDRFLCELNIGSRREVKELLKKGEILINGKKGLKPDDKVDELTAVVSYRGKEFRYRPYVYYMMNKPAGVVSATEDLRDKTVLDLLKEQLSQHDNKDLYGIPSDDIFPVGRLDKDTVGLLLLTNDGALSHRLLSPAKHVKKCYYVETDLTIVPEELKKLEIGVDIGEKALTKEAETKLLSEKSCLLTITEGKFHQVKRMFQAIGLTVTYLKRVSMGSLVLDEDLPEGRIRELTEEEVNSLCSDI